MYVDLTMAVGPETPVYPGSPPPAVLQWNKIDVHGYYINVLFFPEHVATHVDSPAHFVPGAKTVDQIDVSRFSGRFVAVDFSRLSPRASVGLRQFEEALPRGVELGPGWVVLIRTGYDAYAGTDKWLEHLGLSPELAGHPARVDAVGVDAPSPDHEPFEVHKILRGREALNGTLTNLAAVVNRTGQFIGPPMKAGGGGAPVRAVAVV